MSGDFAAHLVALVMSTLLGLLVYFLCRRGLQELLARTISVRGGVDFFMRGFQFVLIFGAIGASLTASLDAKPGENFMEYVWDVAGVLGATIEEIVVLLVVYLLMLTILIASLKPKDDK